LPLPQSPALGMGSVFVYKAADLPPSDLKELVEKGIGERRVDGFGRISVNWPYLATFHLAKLHAVKSSQVPVLSEESAKIARAMAERLLERRLENALVEFVLNRQVTGQITSHALARLRTGSPTFFPAPAAFSTVRISSALGSRP